MARPAAGGPDRPAAGDPAGDAAGDATDTPAAAGDLGSPPPAAPPLALIEVLDAHGQPRQTLQAQRWPVRIGRALDNDLVLGDPHVAAHHAEIAPDDAGTLQLRVGATRNGAVVRRRTYAAGERTTLAAPVDGPLELTLGRTRLRLRQPADAVADELLLGPEAQPGRRTWPLLAAAAVVLVGLLFSTWLDNDPDATVRATATALLSALAGLGLWCGAWALLSKTFAHQARFGWHLRVFLYASAALLAVSTLPKLAAFAFSWSWLSDFDFIGPIAVVATAFYFHLLAVEPARRRAVRAAAVACGLAGVLLTMWFNEQRGDQLGDELYMSHIYPPALRLARPVPVQRLVDRLQTLKEPLDRKAGEPGDAEDGGGGTNDD